MTHACQTCGGFFCDTETVHTEGLARSGHHSEEYHGRSDRTMPSFGRLKSLQPGSIPSVDALRQDLACPLSSMDMLKKMSWVVKVFCRRIKTHKYVTA